MENRPKPVMRWNPRARPGYNQILVMPTGEMGIQDGAYVRKLGTKDQFWCGSGWRQGTPPLPETPEEAPGSRELEPSIEWSSIKPGHVLVDRDGEAFLVTRFEYSPFDAPEFSISAIMLSSLSNGDHTVLTIDPFGIEEHYDNPKIVLGSPRILEEVES